jgi:2,3-bisphosphoglycerate-independent phosphoglycerate mutase
MFASYYRIKSKNMPQYIYSMSMEKRKKVLLVIMDGVGVAPASKGNAVVLAKPRHLTTLWSGNPHTYLLASGESVGLPKGTKGNSEVGHMNIGAGRVVYQTLQRIDHSISKGFFSQNSTLKESLNHAQHFGSKIHLLILASEGSVHSHLRHLIATLDFFSQNNFQGKIYIHAFTDGRDANVHDSIRILDAIQEHINTISLGEIATICGRAWAMDRNKNWDRTKKIYDLLIQNTGNKYPTYRECIQNSYKNNITDEFIEPSVIVKDSNIQKNDAVLFLNFRPDRALQLTQALIEPNFNNFKRLNIYPIFFASMVEYRKDFPSRVIFSKQYIDFPIGNVISSNNLRQLRIAESEKFPHVTYFFNGGTAIKYIGEDRIEVPSPSVATYDLQPEMSALKITDILVSRIHKEVYDFIVVNFANPDMVAHTGNIQATIKAISTVDYCVNRLVKEFTIRGGVVFLTSDHGNAEELINLDTGEMDTEHSYNPVPLIITGIENKSQKLKYGSLKDLSPTILNIMGINPPSEMTGQSLLPSF